MQTTIDRVAVEEKVGDRWVLISAIDVSGQSAPRGVWVDNTMEVVIGLGETIVTEQWTFSGLKGQYPQASANLQLYQGQEITSVIRDGDLYFRIDFAGGGRWGVCA